MHLVASLFFLLTLKVINTASKTPNMSTNFALGAGCYWGTEKYVKKDFQEMFPNSILSAKVGFMSPDPNAMKNPTYRQVCSGSTGHVEVLNVELNDPEKHFEKLVRFFFQFHDPTTKNRQGNDVGTQYASCIFCSDEKQTNIAKKVINELQGHIDSGRIKSYAKKKVETYIANTTAFYEAHEDHQEYLMKNPNGYW